LVYESVFGLTETLYLGIEHQLVILYPIEIGHVFQYLVFSENVVFGLDVISAKAGPVGTNVIPSRSHLANESKVIG
jgi:hypothetical protein